MGWPVFHRPVEDRPERVPAGVLSRSIPRGGIRRMDNGV